MAMIRVDLSGNRLSHRYRLPILLPLGCMALIAVVALYAIDQQVGLLRLLQSFRVQIVATGAVLESVDSPSAVSGSPAIPVARAVTVSVDPPSAVSGSPAIPVASREVVVHLPPTADVSAPSTWWQTARVLSARLPSKLSVTRLVSQVDGVFLLEGHGKRAAVAALDIWLATMRQQGLRAHLTLWSDLRDVGGKVVFVIRGSAMTDAPAPPVRLSIPVEALVDLAQERARAAGLERVSTPRPTHEPWHTGGTRVEQSIGAVGTAAQVDAFGVALAGLHDARLARFITEPSAGGLTQVTASIDVLLGKEDRP